MKVLFVCRGNVARSQMAEAFLKNIKPDWEVRSAGIQTDTPGRYEHPVIEVIEVMAEMGIDVSKQKVKTVNQEVVSWADRIVVMCDKSECPEYLLRSSEIEWWDVGDPHGTGRDNFKRIGKQIKQLVETVF
jgi:arsenate reductase (thioredoxin)